MKAYEAGSLNILSYNELCLKAYENVAKSDIRYHFILLIYNLYGFQIHEI